MSLKGKLIKTGSFYAYIICLLAAASIIYDYFIQVAPSVMTSDLMQSFHIGAGQLGLFGSTFFLGYAIMQIPAGILLDHIGARKCLSAGMLLSGIGVVIFAASHSVYIAGIGRFITGAGSAYAFLSGLFLLSHWMPRKNHSFMIGILYACAGLGGIIGNAPMASLVTHFGWRSVIYAISIITLIIAAIYWIVIRDGGFKSSGRKGFFEYFKGLKEVIKSKALWFIAFVNFCTWMPAATIGAFWGVPYLMKEFGWSNVDASAHFSIFWIALAVASIVVGKVSGLLGRYKLALVISILIAIAGMILLLLAGHLNISLLVIALILLSFAPASQCLSFTLLRQHLKLQRYTTGSSICNMASILSGVIGEPVIGRIIAGTWHSAHVKSLSHYSLAHFQYGIATVLVFLVLALLVVLIFIQNKGDSDNEE